MRRLIPVILILLTAATGVVAKDWRGILPLHSTREDVEALLGPPPPPPENRAYTLHKGRSIYFLDEGDVYFVFVEKDFPPGNSCHLTVPSGTVLFVQVTPKEAMPLSVLGLDEKSLKKFDPSQTPGLGYEGFLDEKEGLVVRTFGGKVQQIVYLPSSSDRGRCPNFYENPESFVSIMICGLGLRFDEYGDLRWSDEKARLDNFAIQLQNVKDHVGYIIVYAGRKAVVAEAQLRANRARDYLINVRQIDPERVKAIDGGYHEDLTVTLFILPQGTLPPLMPTIDPKAVEIIYEKPRRSQRKRK